MFMSALAPIQTPERKNVRQWLEHNRRRWAMESVIIPDDERAPYVCECTSGACFGAIELTALEYEEAHLSPNWLAVLPEHVMPDDETPVVVKYPRFWVLEYKPTQREPAFEEYLR